MDAASSNPQVTQSSDEGPEEDAQPYSNQYGTRRQRKKKLEDLLDSVWPKDPLREAQQKSAAALSSQQQSAGGQLNYRSSNGQKRRSKGRRGTAGELLYTPDLMMDSGLSPESRLTGGGCQESEIKSSLNRIQ